MEHHPVGRENVELRTILIRAVKVNALIYEIIVAEINAIKYLNAVNATLFKAPSHLFVVLAA